MTTVVNRREFLKAGTAASASFLAAATPTYVLGMEQAEPERPRSANDQVHLALIGAGGQGMHDTRTALAVPGVKLVAVADCYDGRLAHSKELWGDDIYTTRDYQTILARADVDVVLIATPDHWHKQAA